MLGHVKSPMRERLGDYDALYERGLRAGVAECRCERWDLIDDPQARPPKVEEFDGLLLSGGPSMVSHGGAWLEAAVTLLTEAQRQGTPTLGICLGHQVVAHAAGAVVGPLPSRNLGTRQVTTLPAARQDPLLGDLPPTFQANVSHSEGVLRLSPAITPLACTDYDPCHALRVGSSTWGVQFHPEFDRAFMSDLLSLDRVRATMGPQRWRATQESLAATPQASAVVGTFARWCAAQADR